ncbi:sensor histidine kinase [Neobacillus jeddahensis]|uniref:sensor histidine kinase n=1 Tax=Neobacillus jeddahensis TaxID=1461580 RepID=UPI0005A7A504|nr:ATP-binding protein [Neobacillus jeddahensis]
MGLHRKIFLALAIAIVGISFVFILLTHLTVKGSIEAGIKETRGKEITNLTKELTTFFINHNHSWENIEQLKVLENIHQDDPEILVMDRQHHVILKKGDAPNKLVQYLGIKHELTIEHERAGEFFYYDPEIANFNKIMIGIPISVVILLIGCGSLLIIISLIIAYRLSKWIAAPLRILLPMIDRLGKGELGIQAPVQTKDEYGKIAEAFNHMSKELEQAEMVRRNLTADVAHELRTPLSIISGKLDVLQYQGQMIKPEALLPLQDELIRLNQLVEDLRILSLAEAGKLELKKIPTNMLDLAYQLLSAIGPLAEEKGISMKIDNQTNDPIICVDPDRMKQVFLNLLTNAIRYTPNYGTIFFRLMEEDPHYLKVTVEDTGIGIEKEHLSHLFDRFYRTDDARTRYSGGTGLGLAIAKQYVLSHDGIIEVKSMVNQGTSFIIQLPNDISKIEKINNGQ